MYIADGVMRYKVTEGDYRRQSRRTMIWTIYQLGWRGVIEQLDTINERPWTKQKYLLNYREKSPQIVSHWKLTIE